MRRILFADNELDITDAVIARANAEFKSRGGVPPAAITAPQAAPKP
jgi:hypothetical protein